ncbi:MAG: hypothetical protein O2917_00380 [Acidobacteria bacterium]|nr:hypothetical protein [Acidobacteriota bacterium]
MADTNHHEDHHGPAGPARVEGDGISYKGLGWAMVWLAAITLVCYAIVWGFYVFMESRAIAGDPPRNALAAPATTPTIVDGRIVSGAAPTSPMLVDEPTNLRAFRAREHELLTTYGWVDQNAGTVRVPIDVAKDLVMAQGLPVRAGAQ